MVKVLTVGPAGTPVETDVAVMPWVEQVLATDYTNSTVTASDVHAGFTPAANTRYLVEAVLLVISASTLTGVQTALAGPTTGITRAGVKITSAASATGDLVTHTTLNGFQASAAGLTTPSLLNLQALVVIGTPGTGAIRIQARSEAALSAVTICAGSSIRWRVT